MEQHTTSQHSTSHAETHPATNSPAPTKKKRNPLVIGCIVLAVIGLCALCGGGGYWGFTSVKKSIEEQQKLTEFANNLGDRHDALIKKLNTFSDAVENADTLEQVKTAQTSLQSEIDGFKNYVRDNQPPSKADVIKPKLDAYVATLDNVSFITKTMISGQITTQAEFSSYVKQYNAAVDRLNAQSKELGDVLNEVADAEWSFNTDSSPTPSTQQ